MGDHNAFRDFLLRDTEADRLERKWRLEHQAGEALAFDAIAYRDMPADLRDRAREWDLEAFICAVWSNAWQCGYLQRGRDEAASRETKPND